MSKKKLNNQGSTLLTVIIILAFVGILGSMMLSVTLTNLQIKVIERNAKENFYTCEIALDEIRTGLHELTVEKIRDIYENDILSDIVGYITYTDEELNNVLKDKVTLALINELGDTSGKNKVDLQKGTPVDAKDNHIFDKYLTPILEGMNIERNIEIGTININPQIGIRVSGICVQMTVNEFESRIVTDIVIELPDFSFRDGIQPIVYEMEQPYKDYALVADGRIISDNSQGDGSTGENTIKGSIYAGKGITIGSQIMQYHDVVFKGGNIVTRGDISVRDTGRLIIDGINKTDMEGNHLYEPAIVWADNIMTDNATLVDKPTIIIDGICIVKDDLTLNGRNSDVTLNGAYIGYTGSYSSLEPSSLGGSSIIVNGINSSLDLSGLDSLVLAGRAQVSVGESGEDADEITDILTGESIAIKSNQKAYLIPEKFIKNINRNPVTSDDRDKYGSPKVDFTSRESDDMDYEYYVDANRQYKKASTQIIKGTEADILDYYYLGFKSGKMADQYLWDYFQGYKGRNVYPLDDNMQPFSIVKLNLPTGRDILVSGNRTSYNYDTEGNRKVEIIPGISKDYDGDADVMSEINGHILENDVYGATSLKNATVGNLTYLYNKIKHLLSLDSHRAYKEGDKVVESIIIPSNGIYSGDWLLRHGEIDGIDYYGGDVNFDTDQTDGKIIIVNGNAIINKNFTGLMIVNGDVTIGHGTRGEKRKINGMIITIDSNTEDDSVKNSIKMGNHVEVKGRLVSRGNIELGSDNEFTASYEDEILKQIFTKQGEALKNIFTNLDRSIRYTETNPVDNLVDLSSMIYYKNWRRE